MLIWRLAFVLHTSLSFLRSLRRMGGETMRGAGQRAEKYSDTWTPNHAQPAWRMKGPGLGGDPWQSRRVAATLGARCSAAFRERTTPHSSQKSPRAFPPQAIAYFCLPDERSQRAAGLKGALRGLSRKPSVLDLSWNDYTVRKIFCSWSQKIVSSCA